MTLGEIDGILQEWQRRSSAIAENLLALQAETTYGLLTGGNGLEQVRLRGVTEARLGPVLRSVHTLFEQFGLLQAVLDEAAAVRRTLPAMFGGDGKGRELQRLLFTRSVRLRVAEVPLSERGLADEAQQAQDVSPAELLERMSAAFGRVRDEVNAVEAAWSSVAGRLDRAETELQRLRHGGGLPSALLEGDAGAVAGALSRWREKIEGDPLGVETEGIAEVDALLARMDRRVQEAARVRLQVEQARVRWEELCRLHAQAAGLDREARAKLVTPPDAAAPAEERQWTALEEWLGRLERKGEEGGVEAVAVGLRNWERAAELAAELDRRVLESVSARLARRQEMRGLLSALKVKEQALPGGAAAGMSDALEQLLFTMPLDLQRAAAALAEFEQRLRRDGARANAGSGVAG